MLRAALDDAPVSVPAMLAVPQIGAIRIMAQLYRSSKDTSQESTLALRCGFYPDFGNGLRHTGFFACLP